MVKAIILAAGAGTRLRPLTYGIPKPLLPVKGRPMIDWVIRSILNDKIDEIIIGVPGTVGEDFENRVLSHIHGVCIDNYVKNVTYNCKIVTVPTPQRETAGDLRYILEEINMNKGEVLVVYGDNLTSFNINQLFEYHEKCRKELDIAGTVVLFEAPENEVHRFGIVKIKKVKEFDLIESFIEKPTLQQAPSKLASAGYYILEVEEIFDMLPREKIKVEHSLFPILASQDKLSGFITKLPYWIDISTIEAYNRANKLAHENLIISPPLPNQRSD